MLSFLISLCSLCLLIGMGTPGVSQPSLLKETSSRDYGQGQLEGSTVVKIYLYMTTKIPGSVYLETLEIPKWTRLPSDYTIELYVILSPDSDQFNGVLQL